MDCEQCHVPLAPIAWPSNLLIALGTVGVPAIAFISLGVDSWWPLVAGLFLFLVGPSVVAGVVPMRIVRPAQKRWAWIVGWAFLLPALLYGFGCLAVVVYGLFKRAL